MVLQAEGPGPNPLRGTTWARQGGVRVEVRKFDTLTSVPKFGTEVRGTLLRLAIARTRGLQHTPGRACPQRERGGSDT